jgi:SAM-dependent methyltransferase
MQAGAGARPLRVLSAGCASGEEAYSVAILAREAMPNRICDVAIRAVDVNPAALEKAAGGRYSTWSLRETPQHVQQKWFRRSGREFILNEAVCASVRFEERNLASDDALLWQPQQFDVVFCRNVVMYFSPAQARALLGRITQALKPGGYLFLGHAEALRGLSDEFHLRHTHAAFYYQRKDDLEATGRGVPLPAVGISCGARRRSRQPAWRTCCSGIAPPQPLAAKPPSKLSRPALSSRWKGCGSGSAANRQKTAAFRFYAAPPAVDASRSEQRRNPPFA